MHWKREERGQRSSRVKVKLENNPVIAEIGSMAVDQIVQEMTPTPADHDYCLTVRNAMSVGGATAPTSSIACMDVIG